MSGPVSRTRSDIRIGAGRRYNNRQQAKEDDVSPAIIPSNFNDSSSPRNENSPLSSPQRASGEDDKEVFRPNMSRRASPGIQELSSSTDRLVLEQRNQGLGGLGGEGRREAGTSRDPRPSQVAIGIQAPPTASIRLELNDLCAAAYRSLDAQDPHDQDAAEESWEPVREWLRRTHTTPHLLEALEARDEGQKTVFHHLGINDAPLDILDHLLLLRSTSIASLDAFGRTPLHYACAWSSSPDFVKKLADECPENKLVQNHKGCTPLHLAIMGSPQGSFRYDANVTAVLSSTGAASSANQEGFMPLHYACAFGASEQVLRVLIDCFPEAMTVRDPGGRNPLHFALANMTTVPKAAPMVVRLLLSSMPSLVNPTDDQGQNPFLFLLNFAGEINDLPLHNSDEQRESIQQCLTLLLDAKPEPTSTVFTALRSLPPWLFQNAILHETVQAFLNQRIKGRFPTATLMTDFYVQFLVLFAYSMAVIESIDHRFDNDPDNDSISGRKLALLYFGATYFCLREMAQILSLIFLRSFREFVRLWLVHPEDWVDTIYVVLVYFWACVMQTGSMSADDFRVGAGLSVGILWIKLLLYLRSISIELAVFITGSFYVVKRLVPYCIVVLCFLGAFTFMFHTVFQQTSYCLDQPNNLLTTEQLTFNLQCEQSLTRPFCSRRSSFLKVLTMFLGEVDDDDFETSNNATWMYIIFMFGGVILLATILIAIVTDSYKIIQDNEAVAVFYTNRLDFIAETDAIANAIPFFQWFTQPKKGNKNGFDRNLWQECVLAWEFDPDERIFSETFFRFRFVPLALSCLIIPVWYFLGFVTAGLLWPPQIREKMFGSNVVWHRSASAQAEDVLQRCRQEEEKKLEEEVKDARAYFYQGLAENRMHCAQIKASVTERKQEMQKECKEIKRIITNLFEQQAAHSQDESR